MEASTAHTFGVCSSFKEGIRGLDIGAAGTEESCCCCHFFKILLQLISFIPDQDRASNAKNALEWKQWRQRTTGSTSANAEMQKRCHLDSSQRLRQRNIY